MCPALSRSRCFAILGDEIRLVKRRCGGVLLGQGYPTPRGAATGGCVAVEGGDVIHSVHHESQLK
jgi:hypothetical protein